MVNWLSNWAQGIIVAVVIATLIELILPNGSSKKYVKVVIGIYILFTIISPIIKKDDFDINEVLDTKKYEQELAKNDKKIGAKLEDNNSRTIKDIYIANLKTDIKSKLKEKGYDVISNTIKIKDDESYTIEKVTLDLATIQNKEKEENNVERRASVEQVNVETVKIQVGNSNSTNENNNGADNRKENNNSGESNRCVLTENQKCEIKEYLSKTYDVDTKNIEIT